MSTSSSSLELTALLTAIICQFVPSYCMTAMVFSVTTLAGSAMPLSWMALAPLEFTFSVAPFTAMPFLNRTLTMPFFNRRKSETATVFAAVSAAVSHTPMPMPAVARS